MNSKQSSVLEYQRVQAFFVCVCVCLCVCACLLFVLKLSPTAQVIDTELNMIVCSCMLMSHFEEPKLSDDEEPPTEQDKRKKLVSPPHTSAHTP